MDFPELLVQNGGFVRQIKGRGGVMLTPNELVLTSTVRVQTDRQTDRQADRHTQ